MFNEGTWVIDTEGDGFNPTKFHCLSVSQDKDEVHSTDSPEKMKEFFLEKCETIIGHNIQRADVAWIERILGISLDHVRIVDTLPLSWALFPEYNKHGLYDWGERFKIPKVEIDDWVTLPVEKYIERCEQDVRINLSLWGVIWNKLLLLYDNMEDINRYIDYLSFKMYCARLQEENKWKVDLKYAHEALTELMQEKEKRVKELSAAMPKVEIHDVKVPPKRMYNKKGELTKLGQAWFSYLEELNLPPHTQEVEYIKSYEEPNPGSNQQVKEWLFSLGWEPQTFKQTFDKEGNTKEVPQINKEKQKGGGVCDSVKKLFGKEPALNSLDGLSILNHRIPILSGFIANSDGGYLRARIAGLTNTLRFVHTEIVNLPKVGLPFADAIRGSLIAREDHVIIGADASNLEDRTKQHYIYPHDPEYVESMLSPDWDAHLDIAHRAGMMNTEEVEEYKKGDKTKKPIRDIAKNGNFAAVYGAGAPKLARTMGISLKKAKEFKEAYNQRNWSVRAVADEQKYKDVNGQLWLYNPVSRFWYSLREVKDIFSTLNQATGVFVFDTWLYYVLEDYKFLIAQFHDEMVLECIDHWSDIERVTQIVKDAMEKVNKKLKLNREMACDVQVGKRYSDVH